MGAFFGSFFSVLGDTYLGIRGTVSAAMACELAVALLVVGVARRARHAAQGHGVRLIRVGRVGTIDRRRGCVVRRVRPLLPGDRLLGGLGGGVWKVQKVQ